MFLEKPDKIGESQFAAAAYSRHISAATKDPVTHE
jgi:hypothetical protein